MRTTNEIREELDQAIARRAELWNKLAQGSDAETSAELAGLSKEIDELWGELRTAEARRRFGSPPVNLLPIGKPTIFFYRASRCSGDMGTGTIGRRTTFCLRRSRAIPDIGDW